MTELSKKRRSNIITITLLLLFIILMVTLISCEEPDILPTIELQPGVEPLALYHIHNNTNHVKL